MANIFSKIGSALKRAYNKVKGFIINKDSYEDILDTVDAVAALAEYAYPAARLVADMTPTNLDNKILDALVALNLKVSDIFDIQDEIVRHGRLLQIAATIARRELEEALAKAKELRIGKFIIKAADAVTNDALRAAASLAYTAIIKKRAIK